MYNSAEVVGASELLVDTQQQDAQAHSIWLYSLPRSGSSFSAAELAVRGDLPYIREPFRRIATQPDDPFHIHAVPHTDHIEPLLDQVSDSQERLQIRSIFEEITHRPYLVKETGLVFHADAIRNSYPELHMVYLARNLLAVINSHLQIRDIYHSWRYDQRIAISRQNLAQHAGDTYSRYSELYDRAERITIKGSRSAALIAAHLGVQALELLRQADAGKMQVVHYETELSNPDTVFGSVLDAAGVPDSHRRRIYTESDVASPHRTKISPQKLLSKAYRWRDAFEPRDMSGLRAIFGDLLDKLVDDPEAPLVPLFQEEVRGVTLSEERVTPSEVLPELPDAQFIPFKTSSGELQVGNRPVTTQEYADFLNECAAQGIRDPHKLLYVDLSRKELQRDEHGIYRSHAQAANAPAVYISPIGAALYAIHKGAFLGNSNSYVDIHRHISEQLSAFEQANISERYASTTAVGTFPPVAGLYDWHGNVRELCLDASGTEISTATFGASYRDETDAAQNGELLPFPSLFSDRDTGFRLFAHPSTQANVSAIECMRSIQSAPNETVRYSMYRYILRAALLPR